MNSKKFVSYLRDSRGEDQDLSIEQQEQAVLAWCIKHGYQITPVFRDNAAPAPGTSVPGTP